MFAVGVEFAERSPAAKGKSWQNVPLTPGRIPSFFVPPKLDLSASPRFRKARDTDEYRLLSTSSPDESSPTTRSPLGSPRFSARFRLTPRSNRKPPKDDLSDPSSRPAMSLQHVDKVTTPYGFRTLAASPTVGRRESLFHKRLRGRRADVLSSPISSPVVPDFQNSPASSGTPRCTGQSPGPGCSAHKPERKGLKMLINPRAALKSLTPGCRRNKP